MTEWVEIHEEEYPKVCNWILKHRVQDDDPNEYEDIMASLVDEGEVPYVLRGETGEWLCMVVLSGYRDFPANFNSDKFVQLCPELQESVHEEVRKTQPLRIRVDSIYIPEQYRGLDIEKVTVGWLLSRYGDKGMTVGLDAREVELIEGLLGVGFLRVPSPLEGQEGDYLLGTYNTYLRPPDGNWEAVI